jgi:hypothetical protein
MKPTFALVGSRSLVEQIWELTNRLEIQLLHEEAVAAGAPRRAPAIIGPRVRSPPLLGGDPAEPKGENGKSVRLSSTDKYRLEQEAALAAKQLQQRAAQPPGQEPP